MLASISDPVSSSGPVPAGTLTIRTLAGGSVQRRVSVAVLVGRVSPEPKEQAQGGGIVAGTGPVQWRGLPSIYIEAGVSLQEGLGPGQPTCRQVPPEATLSALAAGGGGHGTPGLKKEEASEGTQPWPAPPATRPPRPSFRPGFSHPQQEMRPVPPSPSPDDRFEKIWGGGGGWRHTFTS